MQHRATAWLHHCTVQRNALAGIKSHSRGIALLNCVEVADNGRMVSWSVGGGMGLGGWWDGAGLCWVVLGGAGWCWVGLGGAVWGWVWLGGAGWCWERTLSPEI